MFYVLGCVTKFEAFSLIKPSLATKIGVQPLFLIPLIVALSLKELDATEQAYVKGTIVRRRLPPLTRPQTHQARPFAPWEYGCICSPTQGDHLTSSISEAAVHCSGTAMVVDHGGCYRPRPDPKGAGGGGGGSTNLLYNHDSATNVSGPLT